MCRIVEIILVVGNFDLSMNIVLVTFVHSNIEWDYSIDFLMHFPF